MTETLFLRPLLRAAVAVAVLAAPMLMVSKMNAGDRMSIEAPAQQKTGTGLAHLFDPWGR